MYGSVGISLLEEYKKAGKSVNSIQKDLKKGLTDTSWAVKRTRKVPGSVIYSY